MPAFGDLLRQHRVAAGLSQEQLAERSGLSPNGVSALERGVRQRAYRGTVSALADALGLSPERGHEFHAAARGPSDRINSGSRSSPVTNLVSQQSALIGRDREIDDVDAAIATARCVTISGPGGIGKTRVAREAAARFMRRRSIDAWFIDLASSNDATEIPRAIAAAVGLRRPSGDIQHLIASLRSRELLLVLDNCEHLLSGVTRLVGELLRDCPNVSILCTSRERLHRRDETVYQLDPLPVPPNRMLDPADVQKFPAVSLFIERMAAADPHYAATPDRVAIAANICRHLDGIPLAIELAAARAPALGIGMLRARLQEHVFFSADDVTVPERQRTMSATISWSVNLLDEAEKTLLLRLTVFAGSFTMEAAEDVCRGSAFTRSPVSDTLARLIHKSLVTLVPGDEPQRYRLLESVRSYAREQATAEELRESRTRHAGWIATIADRAHAARETVPGDVLTQRLLATLDDTRLALDWALGDECSDETLAAQIVGGMRIVWLYSGSREECRRFGLAALERLDENRHPEIASRLLLALFQSTHGAEMRKIVERAIPIFERLGDRRSIVATQSHMIFECARYGDLADAEAAARVAEPMVITLEGTQSRLYANFSTVRGFLRVRQARYADAMTDYRNAQHINEVLGEYLQVLMDEINLSEVEYLRGDPQGAIDRLVAARVRPEFEPHASTLDAPEANLHFLCGDIERAAQLAAAGLEAAVDFDAAQVAFTIQTLAGVAAAGGHAREGARLLAFADRWFDKEHFARDPVVQKARDVIARVIGEQLDAETVATIVAAAARSDEQDIVREALVVERRL
ncbi:MAG TPA: helix-turn-helix domain-containing protein [Candidatus Tumulicola sp.]